MEGQLVSAPNTDRISELIGIIRQGTALSGEASPLQRRRHRNLVRHQLEWNCENGIRAEAIRCGVLSVDEGTVLEAALSMTAEPPPRVQRAINQLMCLLFCIRKHPTFVRFDREKLMGYTHLPLRSRGPRYVNKRAVGSSGRWHVRTSGGGW